MQQHPPKPAGACPLCDAARRVAESQGFIAELPTVHVVLGENQGCLGWCVAILKHHVEHMDELPIAGQAAVFADVARVARAIRSVFPTSGAGGGPPRINYECLGNLVAHVHWHIIPRHADDPDPKKPVWGWGAERLRGSVDGDARRALIVKLRDALLGRT